MVRMSMTPSRVLHLAAMPRPDGPDVVRDYAEGAGTSRAIAEMNPVNSRAMAIATFGFAFPRTTSFRNRDVRRSWAFHALSQIGLGHPS